jgi:biopolymer transport protein ExbB
MNAPNRICLAAATALLAFAAAPTALGAASPPAGTVSLFEAFFVQRHPETREIELLGTGIVWLLLAMSALCVGLIVSVALATRRDKIMPAGTYDAVRSALERRDSKAAIRAAESCQSFFAATISAALYDRKAGFGAMIRALEQTSEELTVRRLRRVEPLNIVGNVSPMIGLFGTVYGMILAFREIVAAGGSPDPVGLAAGIGTALTTTFWGLIVAIPALTGYALLRNKIDALTLEATREAEELINRYTPRSAKRRRSSSSSSSSSKSSSGSSSSQSGAGREAVRPEQGGA